MCRESTPERQNGATGIATGVGNVVAAVQYVTPAASAQALRPNMEDDVFLALAFGEKAVLGDFGARPVAVTVPGTTPLPLLRRWPR